jgi:hypothetical protein
MPQLSEESKTVGRDLAMAWQNADFPQGNGRVLRWISFVLGMTSKAVRYTIVACIYI